MGAALSARAVPTRTPLHALEYDYPKWLALCAEMEISQTHADRIRAHIFRSGQLHAEIPNIPRRLKRHLEALDWNLPKVERAPVAKDGSCRMRIRLRDGTRIESVLLPIDGRLAQCISTQAGCALGCRFCRTASLGLARNLSHAEMLMQLFLGWRRAGTKPRNIVLMGMGEPMHNLDHVLRFVRTLADPKGLAISPRRITLSTAGVVPGILRLARERAPCQLAISLNAADDATRTQLMPINRRWPIGELLAAARHYCEQTKRKVLIEYVLIAGVNDAAEDAERLARLLAGLPCAVNLIPFNEHEAAPFRRPSPASVDAFRAILRRHGFLAIVRESRGGEIQAACGQLAAAG